MKNTSIFQLVLVIAFGVFAVAGLVVFATYSAKGKSSPDYIAPVTVWGTLNQNLVTEFFSDITQANQNIVVTYVEKSPNAFEQAILEAVADGKTPDIILVPDSLLLRLSRRILPIPSVSLPERTYRDTYAQIAEVFVSPTGVYAIPFAIDPLVMYWNRDIFSSAGIVKPPVEWSALPGLSEQLTERDKALNITKSTVAFGEYDNVRNAKDILAALFIQVGNNIVSKSDIKFVSELSDRERVNTAAALDFYTQFSNPTRLHYSWNRSFSDSRDMFTSDKLALYFGLAGELKEIRDRNPNLNFDITSLPQRTGAPVKRGVAHVYGFSVLKTSRVVQDAFKVVFAVTAKDTVGAFADKLRLAPARIDLLSVIPSDPYRASLFRSAAMSKAWYDPNPILTDGLFGRMVGAVTSGRLQSASAISAGAQELTGLLSKVTFP